MKKANTDKDLCRIITPEFRVSYPHVFKPQAPKGQGKPKFSITMLFPKKGKDIIGSSPDGEERGIKECIRAAKTAKFGPKENWPKGLLSPVADGDDPKYEGKLGYAGCWVMKATSQEDQPPTIVGPTADDYKKLITLTKPSELYPGCYARAFIFAYYYNNVNEGIGFILDHVQKLRDGKAFGGKRPAEEVFSPIEASDDDAEEVKDEDEDF